MVPWSSLATGAALTTTRRLLPAVRMAFRMLAVPADVIDDLFRDERGPRADTTASASATAAVIASGSRTSAATSFSRSWRTGSLAGSLTTR